MNRFFVAALPLLLSAAVAALFASTEPTPTTYRVVGLLARAVAAVGCLIGALQFDRGDYLRRAWAVLGASYVAYFLNALVFGAVSHGATRNLSASAAWASGGIVVLGNVAAVTGAVLLSRAWSQAGLALGVSSQRRHAVFAGSLALGLLVAGPSAVTSLRDLLSGDLDSLVHVASAVGDIATLAVLGPILLTALALRGGSLAWPWALAVVGTFGWLVYDATLTVANLAQLERVRAVEETLRMFACGSFLAAGLLQAMAVRVSAAPVK